MDSKKYPELLAIVFAGLLVFFVISPLENFSGNIVGHFLGIIGTLLMIATLIYVFRKRILKQKGKSNPLNPHIYFGLIGGIFVVIHSGSKSASLIGILVFIGMLLTIMSGIVGRLLVVRLNRSIKANKSDVETLEASLKSLKHELNPIFCQKEFKLHDEVEWVAEDSELGLDPQMDPQLSEKCSGFQLMAESLAEREELFQIYSKTKSLFTFWNNIHIASTSFLFAMVIVHVMTTLYYGLRWMP